MAWKRKLGIGCGVLAGALVLLCGGVVAGGYALDPELELETSATLDASPEAVFDHLDDVEGLRKWWGSMEGAEAMEIVALEGPEAGAGIRVGFEMGGTRAETWELVEIEAPERVVYDVDFAGMFVVRRTLTVTPEGNGAHVVWHETGRIDNPVFRWLTVLMGPEDTIANFEMALGALGDAAGG